MNGGVCVYLLASYLFWADKDRGVIERSYLDGAGRKPIVRFGVTAPTKLVVDYTSDRLMWLDTATQAILSSDLDGRSRRMVLRAHNPYKAIANFDIFQVQFSIACIVRACHDVLTMFCC